MIAGLIFLGAVLAACFLSSVIMYLEYVNSLKPNSAIKLNFYNAVYAYKRGKITKHLIYNEYFYKEGEKEIPIYIGYFTYMYLAFLRPFYKKRTSKVNKHMTYRFLKELYNKGEEYNDN